VVLRDIHHHHPAERWTDTLIIKRFRRVGLWPCLFLLCVAVVFVVLWRAVIAGHQGLVGSDILANLPPWSTGAAPKAPRNALVVDPVSQFLPWLTSVRAQLFAGHLPLWNPDAFAGAPLLANDQSAPFSPFTLVALPFAPAHGYSLAMLLKLVVAGVGMGAFLRQLRVGYSAAMVAGVAYAGSSFMVVWLGHPQSAVAAIFPWAFAFVEMWLRTRRKTALAGLALSVALQFLAGHAETSLQLGLMLVFYALVRFAQDRDRRQAIIGMVIAAALGTALAGIQLIPFLAELRTSTIVANRSAGGLDLAQQQLRDLTSHLQLRELISWIIPNGSGNPGIDGLPGPFPNYLESTAFIGVAALLLGALGIARVWRRQRSLFFALGLPVLFAAGVVYGPLTPLARSLPLLSLSSAVRMIAVMCLGMAAFAGLGFQAVVDSRARWSARWARIGATSLLAAGAAALTGVVIMGLVLAAQGAGVDSLLPAWYGSIGFWVLLAALSGVAALCFLGSAGLGRGRRGAAGGLACLVLAEAAIFAGPFQPRVPLADYPPPSAAIAWLQAHTGGEAVAGQGLDLMPNLATLYGLRDVRGYDVTIDPRVRLFWSHADPGYADQSYVTALDRPAETWLAAAGVRYYVSSPGGVPAGATSVIEGSGFTISEVSATRPFVFAASSVTTATGAADAVTKLALAPLGPVVVETSDASPPTGQAIVAVTRQEAGAVDLDVTATSAATVVVLQSYAPDWVAQIDGSAVPIRAADVLFQSVAVPAGHHVVTLRYRPASVSIGLASSAAGVIGLGTLFAVPALLRRRRRGRAGTAAS
jgi:Bacterial membrane protein YfhO